jgi:hypothetical protein
MSRDRDGYASYLLRLRRSDQDGRPIWRASLESTRNGQRMDFDSVESLIAFLSARFGLAQPKSADESGEASRRQRSG